MAGPAPAHTLSPPLPVLLLELLLLEPPSPPAPLPVLLLELELLLEPPSPPAPPAPLPVLLLELELLELELLLLLEPPPQLEWQTLSTFSTQLLSHFVEQQ